MNRRRFAFWIGFGLFSLAEKLRLNGLDALAAVVMEHTDSTTTRARPSTPLHWTAAENKTWRWFERECLIDGRWTLTGITTPIHKKTGEAHVGDGYLDESAVPKTLRLTVQKGVASLQSRTLPESAESLIPSDNFIEHTTPEPYAFENVPAELLAEFEKHQPSEKRRGRHGRPPSKWLRSLRADEIRIWLKTIEVPEAGVEGMTFWTHLTRDHYFDEDKIEGLTEEEQAKLHAAAHYGY
jgi:hypothetical protein